MANSKQTPGTGEGDMPMRGINIQRAFERETLPTHAGAVKLYFASWRESDRAVNGAYVIDAKPPAIEITFEEHSRFYPLQGGDQCVVDTSSPSGNVFFAGCDERAFATRITSEAFQTLTKRGEKAFYEYLKPPIIAALEKMTKKKALRQGDVWAMPLGITLNDLVPRNIKLAKAYVDHGDLELTFQESCDILSVNGHWVVGCRIYDGEEIILRERFPRLNSMLCEAIHDYDIVCGVLKAEDHKPLDLTGEFHLLARTRGLVEDED